MVLVLDKGLHDLPFACLEDRETGRYLLEDHEIALAPSATLYVQTAPRRAPRAGTEILLVGNPEFDRDLFPTLSLLPGAAAETSAIAGLYALRELRLLAGEDADKSSFLELAPLSRRIHLAGHAVANESNPLLSMLVLAPEGEDPGLLYAWEIYQMDLARTELVVLAACDTGSGPAAGEAVVNLARAFLAAGVRDVVASLWEVGDETTSSLFRVFHHHLLAHPDPVTALRQAQLSLLHGHDPASRSPEVWGAFAVIGASAD